MASSRGSISVELRNINKLGRELLEIAERSGTSALSALFEEGQEIMTAAKKRTPVDTGDLRRSGTVRQKQAKGARGRDIEVTLQFGGPAAPYALEVHENLKVKHRVGEAKFLERAVNEAARTMSVRLVRRMSGTFSRSGRKAGSTPRSVTSGLL